MFIYVLIVIQYGKLMKIHKIIYDIIILLLYMDYKGLLLFFVTALVTTIPPSFIKLFIENNNYYLIFLSIIFYLILIFCYYLIFTSYKNITIIYSLVKITSVLILVTFGVAILHEKLSIKSIIGIILGLISIYLLSSNIK
jgi:drug/metabolite transporter (DMT)-like permease